VVCVAAPLIADAFRSGGEAVPRWTVSTDNGRLSTYLLASGRFLTLLPDSMVRLTAKYMPVKVLPVDIPDLPRPVVILTLKNRALSPVAKLFIECVRAFAESLETGK
jgi:DNA-binding transcriptional LysR family regulator